MSANVQAMIQEGKRSLREGNRIEAQQLLLRATELDESNEEAWLWSASAVDDAEEKRICLENVLVLNPDNSEAKRMLAELDRGSSGSPAATESFSSAPFIDADPGMGPRDTSQQPVVEFGDSDPFGDIFSSSGFEVADGGADGGAAASDGPFSTDFSFSPSTDDDSLSLDAAEPDADDEPVAGGLASAPLCADPDEDLSSLYDDDDDFVDAEQESLTDMGLFDERAGVTGDGIFADGTASDVDILADDDDFYDSELDDDEVDHLTLLPDSIRPTRLPGSDEAIGTGVVVGIVLLGLLNVAAVVGLVLQLVL